jgi:NTE family protein
VTNEPRRVVIACQGGGSHTAFTAGVLKRLFQSAELSRYQIVGLSGTSGGAVCALLTWYALLEKRPRQVGVMLDEFWADNSANTPLERLVNSWVVWAGALEHFVVAPAVSPYDTYVSITSLDEFRAMLERRVDFDGLSIQTDMSEPMLVIGAVDVLNGEFKAFNSRVEKISAEMILASAAIPTLFRSVRVDDGTYWDGLFSQNPPIKELIDAGPDEIWVIQINPKTRPDEPKNVVDIADRRNELSGNLSLHQELHFIEKIDQLLDEGLLASDGRYKPVVVRLIELSHSLGTVSKLNRDPSFIRSLMRHGEERAADFLASLAFEEAWAKPGPRRCHVILRQRRRTGVFDPLPQHKRPVPGYRTDSRVCRESPDRRCDGRSDKKAGGEGPGHLDRPATPPGPRYAGAWQSSGRVQRRQDHSLSALRVSPGFS